MWLSWSAATIAALLLTAVRLACRRVRQPWLALTGAVAKEAAIILGLYAFWQKGSDWAVTRSSGAVGNARWIQHAERAMRLPTEASWQRWVLPHPLLVQALNFFYAVIHVPALVVFLIWMFVRHRDRYARWRNIGAFMTGVALLIQMIPVAPPRLMPNQGFVDTAVLYKQSVYGTGGIKIAPQLAAMPSVHVAWAVLVATAVIACGTSKWRWFILLHPAATTFAVVTTANHWWLDGLVAAALLPIGALVVDAVTGMVSGQRAPQPAPSIPTLELFYAGGRAREQSSSRPGP